ncbi:MAG TPA: prepilin peptidase [Gemmatimonadales bacterium]|nr:prepilin peptidase [Gemmatimonadales bacterium]
MPAELTELRPFVIALAGLLGAVVGSFLNVCILRWGAEPKESVVHPPSRCPHCSKGIAWYDNVPILSWLALRGRCRGCGSSISAQYPLVELAAALVWMYAAWRYAWSLEAVRGAAFGTILLGIAMTDARAYLIPNEFSLGGLVIGLVLALAAGLGSDWLALRDAAVGAGVGFGLLWAVGAAGTWFFKQEAMGGGDIKMMAMVGVFLGWKGVLLTLFLGALLGSLVFVPLHLFGHRKLVPFGVFLALGAAAAWVVGPAVYAWYAAHLGLA